MRTLILSLTVLVAASLNMAAQPGPVREEWRQVWRTFDVDPAVAESVVWPEMQLYVRLRDEIESAADYLAAGGLDFSIGIFQMKPSFAGRLEAAWMGSGFADLYDLRFDLSDSMRAIRDRVERLEVDEWQVIYLGMFLRLLYSTYGLESLSAMDQVRLAANAYNRGCAWPGEGGDPETLRRNIDVESFPRVIIRTANTRQRSYAALAWEHYQALAGNN